MDEADGLAPDGTAWQRLSRSATVALAVPEISALGTGFLLAPGIVATCAHVVAPDASALPARIDGLAVHSQQPLVLAVRPEHYFRTAAGLDVALLHVASNEREIPYVLPHRELAIGDPLWTYGHPDGMFRAGQPATFTFEGESRRDPSDGLTLLRLRGTPVGGGFSGSAVINRRTGAVCGMLCTSDKSGSAHMLPIDEIVERCDTARLQRQVPEIAYRDWLGQLTDAQLRAGGWAFPGPRLRAYLRTAARAAQSHSYPNAVPEERPPTLSEVYVHQHARPGTTAGTLSADLVFERASDSLLVGGPGTGKSSLLRAAVIALADRWERGGWKRGETAVAPVRILASDLVAPHPLPEAIARAVRTDLSTLGLRQSWPSEFFADPPVAGARWLVLVDGLDEMMDPEQRKSVVAKLSGTDDGLYQFIVATRPVSYPAASDESQWQPIRYELLRFDEDQYTRFAIRWFTYLRLADPAGRAKRFIERIKQVGLDDLARTPLVATMLCQIFAADPEAVLPASRTRLYKSFVDLVQAPQYYSVGGIRHQIKEILAPYGGKAELAGEALLERAADLTGFLAWSRQQGQAEASVDLLAARTVSLRPRHVPEHIWHSLLREMLRRSGVVVEYGADFSFLHQTIEEFLAAQFVANDPELSEQEFHALLGVSLRPQSVPIARQSYIRFLVAAWTDRPDLDPALTRLAASSGPSGLRFLASLAADGVVIPPMLAVHVADGLSAIAQKTNADEFDRRSALEAMVPLDELRAVRLLKASIINSGADRAHRLWAVVALAQVVSGQNYDARDDAVRCQQAMRFLASTTDPEMLNLLSNLARDSTLGAAERLWAANAVFTVDRAHGTAALTAVSDDRSVDSSVRRWAAEASATHATKRVRSRLARRIKELKSPVNAVLEPLAAVHRLTYPNAELELLQQGYDFAARWHVGQVRMSGDPYITHPLAVATILAEIRLDTETVVAGLLHGVLEHTSCRLEDLRNAFGDGITALVDAVTEFDNAKLGTAAEAETIRKLIIAAARDPRGLVLKLADRLHNLRTVRFLPEVQQARKARETLEILVPLARRIGLNTVAWELEDLAFATLFPARYDEVVRLVASRTQERDQHWEYCADALARTFKATGIKAQFSERFLHYYPIHVKITQRGVTNMTEIASEIGAVILVDTVQDCYAALGVVHELWNPVPGRFTDYIASPRFGIYQSLHTTVIGPIGKPIEIHIRTYIMNRSASYGIVTIGGTSNSEMLPWLRQMLDWQREMDEPSEFLEMLRLDLASKEVYVFTPKGKAITLPERSTPVDFAYAIHSQIGHQCFAATVNGHLVGLAYILQDGDTVEIETAETAVPDSKWLSFVQTPRAKAKIKQWIAANDIS